MEKYILLIVGLSLSIFTGRNFLVGLFLRLNGVKTVGTVYKVVLAVDEDDDSYIGVSYEVNGKLVYNNLPYESLKVGDSVSLVYNPKKPYQIGYADYIPIQEVFWLMSSLLLAVVGVFVVVKG